MIYNWNEARVLFDPTELKDISSKSSADWQGDSDRTYFTVKCSKKELVGSDGRYKHPTEGDVFIDGDDAYGMNFVLSSTRKGADWEFVLVLHKLVKHAVGVRKTFKAPFSET